MTVSVNCRAERKQKLEALILRWSNKLSHYILVGEKTDVLQCVSNYGTTVM